MVQGAKKASSEWVAGCGKWQIHTHPPKGRASLSLLPRHPSRGLADPLELGLCESEAEAIVVAKCLQHNDEIEFGKHLTRLSAAGYVKERHLGIETRAQITDAIASGPNGEPPRTNKQQWWCNRDRTMFIVTDEHGSCPMFSFHIEDQYDVHPGISLHQPVAYLNGRPSFLPFGSTSPVSAYVFAYLEILKERLQVNGYLQVPLRDTQHVEVVLRATSRLRPEDDDVLSGLTM